jgi:D-aminopeptidase
MALIVRASRNWSVGRGRWRSARVTVRHANGAVKIVAEDDRRFRLVLGVAEGAELAALLLGAHAGEQGGPYGR